MRKHGIKKFVATLLAAGILVTSVFPGTAYAAEVGEDIAEDIAEDVLEQSGNETDTGEQTEEEMVATVGTENKTEESESVTEAELETKEPVKAEEKQQTTEVVQEQNRESDWGNEEEKTKDKEEKEAKEKQLEKKEQKVSANPNGENLGWKSAYASETNLFERNLKDEKEFLVDSTTNKVVIYSDGYTVNGTYYGYQSSSTPTNRRSDFEVLKFYLEATGKQNIYLQTNITCTSPITVVGTKGLHGYGYYLKQNLQDQYDTFTYRDGVYLDSSIINVPAGATLKIAHVEMEGQAAENKICGVVDVNGNNKKTWSNEEAKKRNKDTKNGEVPQYAAVHDGISSKGKLYVTNVKIHHCKRGVLVSDGTATINGGCYYYNKGSGITVLNKTESGKVRLNGVNCFANSSTSNAKNGNAFGTGKYCNFVAPDEASYSGINLHVSTTICAWTPEGLGVTYYPITRKNERFGIAATQGDHGTYVFHEVRASENEKDGVCIKNKTVTITNGILSNNVENGLQIGSNAMVTINGSATSVNDNQQKGVWNAGTLTVNDGNFYHNTKEGILNTGTLTVNGGSYYSNAPSGVNSTGILTIHNGKIYDNEKEGVKNSGKLILCGGDIYGNKTYGVYNTGAFTMSGGKVRDNDSNGTAAGGTKKDGIYNIGTVNVSGGTISGNDSGLYNLSTANVTGGTIKENGNGIRNNTDPTTELSGTTTINGTNVNITGNTRGIQNTADENGVKVIKATITGNTTADLSQSGETFTISGSNTKADIIELGVNDKGECEVVTLDGVPAETKKVVFKSKKTFEAEYKSLPNGETKAKEAYQKNMSIGRPMFKCINTTPKAVLDSGKLVFADGKQITLVKDKEEKAIMRPFKGSNMNESLAGGNITGKDKYIVLSTKYAANYKVAEKIDGIEFILPDSEDIFWNEENAITLKPLKAIINGVEQVFDIAGWLKDGIGNAIEVGKKIFFGVDESDRNHELVAQLGMCNLVVSGNGQSDGEDYVIEKFNCAKDKLPQNTFEKEFKDNWYYIEMDEQKQHETKYSYQGWSLSNAATYQSEGVMQPQGKLDYADVLAYIDSHKDSITYGDNGLPNIPLYVVWDKYPELQAKEIGFAEMELDQSLNEGMKQSYYLDDKAFASVLYERVVGTDDEDGALTNGIEEKGVICEDSLEDLRTELLSFEHTGATTVTFKATDGVGNVTERRVRVWINKGKEIEEAYINRARVINRKYYNVGKEYADKLIEDNKKRSESEQIGVYEISVACMALRGELDRSDKGDAYIEAHKAENPALGYLTGYNRGGLMPIDKWYTDPEYRKCIEEAFDNQENETPEYSWKFTHEQVLETQEYVETYGISTSEHPDALWNYFNKYKSSFKKLK